MPCSRPCAWLVLLCLVACSRPLERPSALSPAAVEVVDAVREKVLMAPVGELARWQRAGVVRREPVTEEVARKEGWLELVIKDPRGAAPVYFYVITATRLSSSRTPYWCTKSRNGLKGNEAIIARMDLPAGTYKVKVTPRGEGFTPTSMMPSGRSGESRAVRRKPPGAVSLVVSIRPGELLTKSVETPLQTCLEVRLVPDDVDRRVKVYVRDGGDLVSVQWAGGTRDFLALVPVDWLVVEVHHPGEPTRKWEVKMRGNIDACLELGPGRQLRRIDH